MFHRGHDCYCRHNAISVDLQQLHREYVWQDTRLLLPWHFVPLDLRNDRLPIRSIHQGQQIIEEYHLLREVMEELPV